MRLFWYYNNSNSTYRPIDTSTTEYFNNKKNESEDLNNSQSSTSASTQRSYGSASPSMRLLQCIPSATTSMFSSGTFCKNQRNNQQQPLQIHHIHDSQFSYVTNGSEISKSDSFGESNRISSNSNISNVQMQFPPANLSTSSLSTMKSHRNPQHNHFKNSASSSIGISMFGNVIHESGNNIGMNYITDLQTSTVQLRPTLTKADSIDIFDSMFHIS